MARRPVRRPRDRFALLVGPVFLALYIVAGQIKEHPLLAWLPVDLTIGCALIVALAFLVARVQLGTARGWIALPIAIWTFLFAPVLAWTALTGYGLEKVSVLFTLTLLLAVAPFQLLRTELQRRAFLATLVVVGLFAAVWALVVRPTTASEWTTRLVLEGTDTIGTARLAMGAAIVLVTLALAPRTSGRLRLLAALGATAVAFLAFVTGSRGPVLGAVFALALVTVVVPLYRRYRGRAILMLTVVAGLSAWSAVGVEGFDRVIAVLLGDSDNSSRTRVMLWERAWEQIAANPWGAGWGGFNGLTDLEYPHNLLLELGAEIGWIPTFAVIALLAAANIRALRSATTMVQASFSALLAFATMNAMVSADVNGSRLMWVLVFASWAVKARHAAASPELELATQGSARATDDHLNRPGFGGGSQSWEG